MEKRKKIFNREALDNCPIIQECRRIRKEVAEERRRDPAKFKAETQALMKELGMKYAKRPPTPPWVKEFIENTRKRQAARESAKQ